MVGDLLADFFQRQVVTAREYDGWFAAFGQDQFLQQEGARFSVVEFFDDLACNTDFAQFDQVCRFQRQDVMTYPGRGLVQGFGEIVGAAGGAWAAGRAADTYGLSIVMWIMVACALIAGALALLLRETAPVKVLRSDAGS